MKESEDDVITDSDITKFLSTEKEIHYLDYQDYSKVALGKRIREIADDMAEANSLRRREMTRIATSAAEMILCEHSLLSSYDFFGAKAWLALLLRYTYLRLEDYFSKKYQKIFRIQGKHPEEKPFTMEDWFSNLSPRTDFRARRAAYSAFEEIKDTPSYLLGSISSFMSEREFEYLTSCVTKFNYGTAFKIWHSLRRVENIMANSAQFRIVASALNIIAIIAAMRFQEEMPNKSFSLLLWASVFGSLSFICTVVENHQLTNAIQRARSYILEYYSNANKSGFDKLSTHLIESLFEDCINYKVITEIHSNLQLMNAKSKMLPRLCAYKECDIICLSLLISIATLEPRRLHNYILLRKVKDISQSCIALDWWRRLTFQIHPPFWNTLLLMIDTFPKRKLLLYQCLPVMPLHVHHLPIAVASSVVFCSAVTVLDAVKDLTYGVDSPQVKVLREVARETMCDILTLNDLNQAVLFGISRKKKDRPKI